MASPNDSREDDEREELDKEPKTFLLKALDFARVMTAGFGRR